MAEKASKESTFTDKEIEYMAAAMISLKEGLPTNAMIDTAKFSARTGLTEGSSRVIWNKLRQKLAAQGSGDGVPATPKPSKEIKPSKTPISKRKPEEGQDEETGDTPSKKPRARKPKSAQANAEEVAVQGDEVNDEEAV